jgi:ribosome-associated protein
MPAEALSCNAMGRDETDDISKSQRKRDLHALKDLGIRLLEFSDDSLRQLDIPDTLLEALLEARRITSNNARKRQLAYIGKLMKEIDPAPVQAAIAARDHQHDTATREFHLLESLRDQLLLQGDDALPAVLAHFPRGDRAYLRKLARQARREQETRQPPRAARLLFRYLRELQEEPDY